MYAFVVVFMLCLLRIVMIVVTSAFGFVAVVVMANAFVFHMCLFVVVVV